MLSATGNRHTSAIISFNSASDGLCPSDYMRVSAGNYEQQNSEVWVYLHQCPKLRCVDSASAVAVCKRVWYVSVCADMQV